MAIQHEKYAKLKLTEWKGMSVLHVSILYIHSLLFPPAPGGNIRLFRCQLSVCLSKIMLK